MNELGKPQALGIFVGLVIIVVGILQRDTPFFMLLIGAGIIVAALPFVILTIKETKANTEKEKMFLEFARNLVESVKMGSPISKSIMNVKGKGYGVLGPHINKLSNQISMGIPLNTALMNFSKDVKNNKISRAITLIGQAERAGGDIGEILESVAEAVSTADKLKKERKSAISTLAVQGYIIFFVFLIIILVMQFQILPMVSGIASLGASGGVGSEIASSSGSSGLDPSEIANAFLYLLLVQGAFSGLIIGQLTEGTLKSGIKHSFILMLAAFLVSTGANAIFGG